MRSGLLLVLVLVLGWEADATPLRAQDEEQFDRHLDKFVRVYYERFVKNQEPSDEGMQADQPVDQQADMPVKNQTQDDFLRAMRNRYVRFRLPIIYTWWRYLTCGLYLFFAATAKETLI